MPPRGQNHPWLRNTAVHSVKIILLNAMGNAYIVLQGWKEKMKHVSSTISIHKIGKGLCLYTKWCNVLTEEGHCIPQRHCVRLARKHTKMLTIISGRRVELWKISFYFLIFVFKHSLSHSFNRYFWITYHMSSIILGPGGWLCATQMQILHRALPPHRLISRVGGWG